MSPHGYEEIEHTADLALKVWGEDFSTLLTQAARGMYTLLGAVCDSGELKEYQFSIKAGSAEEILVDFLSEVLYLAEDKELYFQEFTFIENCMVMTVGGSCQKIASFAREIKAVTFHNLTIRRTEQGLETTITFDA